MINPGLSTGSSRHAMYVYSLTSRSFITKDTPPLETWCACVTYNPLDDIIYSIGGFDGPTYFTYVQRYDVAGDQWLAAASDLKIERSHNGCAVSSDGILYTFGGYNNGGFLNSIERYSNDEWTTIAATLKVRRNNVKCRTLTGLDRILCVGGYTGSYETAVDTFQPSTETMLSTTTSLKEGRRFFTMTLWNNGQCIVVTGGWTTGSSQINSIETYGSCTGLPVTSGPTTTSPTQKPTEPPTRAPTTLPTTSPTTNSPTQDPTQYPSSNPTTSNPTLNPTSAPTVPPSIDPTLSPITVPTPKPTVDPTVPTYIPTFVPSPIASVPTTHPIAGSTALSIYMTPAPTARPAASQIYSNYIISIVFNSCEQEDTAHSCDINKTTVTSAINAILVAYIDYNTAILSTDVINNEAVIIVSIATDQIDDTLSDAIEHEFEDKYGDDVDVTVKKTNDRDETEPTKENESWGDNIVLVVVVVILILGGICIFIGYRFHIMQRKHVQNNQKMVQRELQQGPKAIKYSQNQKQKTTGNIIDLFVTKRARDNGANNNQVLDEIEGEGEKKVVTGYDREGDELDGVTETGHVENKTAMRSNEKNTPKTSDV